MSFRALLCMCVCDWFTKWKLPPFVTHILVKLEWFKIHVCDCHTTLVTCIIITIHDIWIKCLVTLYNSRWHEWALWILFFLTINSLANKLVMISTFSQLFAVHISILLFYTSIFVSSVIACFLIFVIHYGLFGLVCVRLNFLIT